MQACFESKKNKPANKSANKVLVKLPKQIIPKNSEGKPNLAKRWFIIYSFNDPITKKPKRFYEYGGVNSIKSVSGRKKALSELCAARTILINAGWNPYNKFNPSLDFAEKNNIPATAYQTINFLLTEKLTKQKNVANLKSRGQIFLKWITKQKLANVAVDEINYQICAKFIAELKVSNRTKNNYIIDLRTIFNFGLKTQLVSNNPFVGIDFYKTSPQKHEVFTQMELDKLLNYMKANKPQLYLFVRFFSVCFLRPKTLTQLQVKDFDLQNRTIKINPQTEKNAKEYLVLIPEILKQDFNAINLHKYPANYYVFTVRGVSKEPSWRDSFTAQFLECKKALKINDENKTMYGFRHTLTRNIYLNLRKQMNKQEAINALITITRHKTVTALEKYLRQIGADVPDDYSNFITIDI